MAEDWVAPLERWASAGVIDEETAARIRLFETGHARATGFRWPVWLALGFGALMLGAALLLFVSAHWDSLSPEVRFGLIVLLVAGFHVAGAFVSQRFPAMAVALHAVGTVALGAGIYLAGQVFNLDEHWPGGVMLWALGALVAWSLLRHWPQLALVAVLAPAWLLSEWFEAFRATSDPRVGQIAATGCVLLALAYFTASGRGDRHVHRRVLLWIGGLALLGSAGALASLSWLTPGAWADGTARLSTGALLVGWALALGVPLTLAAWLRGRAAWVNGLAACWAVALIAIPPDAPPVWRYAWWGLGAAALASWGVRDGRSERINMGAALFAVVVVAFYFSEVFDRLGRAGSLAGLGALFLVGGVALERARRRLVLEARGRSR
jgi:hypothetical protein